MSNAIQDSYSLFGLKFRCHGNQGRSSQYLTDIIWWLDPQTPCELQGSWRCLSHKSIIANFAWNFVAMATGVGRSKKTTWHGGRGKGAQGYRLSYVPVLR